MEASLCDVLTLVARAGRNIEGMLAEEEGETGSRKLDDFLPKFLCLDHVNNTSEAAASLWLLNPKSLSAPRL